MERATAEVLAGWDAGVSGTAVHGDRLVHVEFVWGTAITVELAGVGLRQSDARTAVGACQAWFAEVDARFSPYRPLSEVTAARNGLAHPTSRDFAEVLRQCRQVRDLTGGAFDPWRVPGGYDPLGLVKGWAAGRASTLLRGAGFADHMVNAGGDVTCAGDRHPGSGRGWRIGIVDPDHRDRVVRTVAVQDASIATSALYERGAHVLDPRTQQVATGADSATVVGPDAGWADALASAVLVDGPGCLSWFTRLGPAWSVQLVRGGREWAHGPAFSDDAPGDSVPGDDPPGPAGPGAARP